MGTDYNRYDDDELVLRLGWGKQQALVALYNRYWDKLFVIAANLLDDAEEAEECVQNVFLSLWKRRENLRLTHSLNTYLSVAVKYQSLSAITRNQRRSKYVDKDALADPIDSVSPEIELMTKELWWRIEQSINRLPTQCQLVFRMSREEDMPIKNIAKELCLSENTVKMHLKSANRKLRDDLLVFLPIALTLFADRGL